ncbi:MAG: YihY/virulence factor BrkB family protein [Alkalispirochaeta sp.]
MAQLHIRTKRIIRRYIEIHGPLLAKGLSFSALFATVPLLFLLSVAGSIALTPEVQELLQDQFLGVLPNSAQVSINTSMSRLANSPGSLSIASFAVFLWSVHQLFFDVHRVVRAGFGMAVSPARGRARAVALSGLFLLLIYATALLNLMARIMEPHLPVSGFMLHVGAVGSSTVILTVVLWSLIRLGSGVPLRVRGSIIPVLGAAVVWQGASWLAGLAVRSAGRRLIVYGVLASAVLFLMLMRVYAEILIHTSLWIRELRDHPLGTEE